MLRWCNDFQLAGFGNGVSSNAREARRRRENGLYNARRTLGNDANAIRPLQCAVDVSAIDGWSSARTNLEDLPRVPR